MSSTTPTPETEELLETSTGCRLGQALTHPPDLELNEVLRSVCLWLALYKPRI